MNRYINADKLKESMSEPDIVVDGEYYYNDSLVDNFIDNFGTADVVEVVHGHWVYAEGLDVDNNRQANCSVCGAGDLHSPSVAVPYCWRCGAHMVGVNENEKE